jgi:CheY-like chemotaxis protein
MDDFTHKLTYSKKEVEGYLKSQQIDFSGVSSSLSFRELPGGHLRISKDALSNFFSDHKIPLPEAWHKSLEAFKVLIVDDDPDLLEIMSELLSDESRIVIRSEKNGFNAEIQLKGWKPDLLLLDFLMSGISGFEICKRLRKDPEFLDLPILAITSLTSTENKVSVIQSGVSDFLGKPFYSENLLLKVRKLLALD